MRALIAALVICLIWTSTAGAQESVEDYVNLAITALKNTSYRARMSYLSQYDQSGVEQVYIVHVAPELYHVSQLVDGVETGPYYIENAVELVHVTSGLAGSKEALVNVMPKRRFYTNDALTSKFLRDLGSYEGSTMLSGSVGNNDVWVIRQDAVSEKPYMITVGLDKRNYFPLFLLVNDADGNRRVYYEMEAIEYYDPADIDDNFFVYSQEKENRMSAPRVNQLSPQDFDTLGTVEEGYGVMLKATSELQDMRVSLPLYPYELPEGYQIESISLLNFDPIQGEGETEDAFVYQLEIFGPRGDLLSIFQTHLGDQALAPNQIIMQEDQHYVMLQVNGWLLAAFGDLTTTELQDILQSLESNDDIVSQLLEETKARDLIIQKVISGSEH